MHPPPISAVLALVLSTCVCAQDSRPARDLRVLAGKAARAKQQLLVRFVPSGVPDAAELDAAIAADESLAKAFSAAFLVESVTPLDPDAKELAAQLKSPMRGTWPGLALVDRTGELLSVVDAATWKTAGKWDPARIAAFVDFWTKPQPKSDRLAQVKQKYGKIYDPDADAMAAVDAAIAKAKAEGKHVLVKIGGNWCPWCYFLHDELETRQELKAIVESAYVLVRVSWEREKPNDKVMARLDNPTRFGFPVLVVLDGDGKRLHTQDSGLLEVGDHHDPRQVSDFLRQWTPSALKPRR